MRIFLYIINQIITLIVNLYGLYYILIGIFGALLINKTKKLKKAKKDNHFAIIVPARNEEIVIGNLIDSLKVQNYPKNKYDIYVVVNNTTDNTKKVAKSHGAKVIDCDVPVKAKADVLSFTFDKLKSKENIDAYIIFDADNVAHPDFLKEMNKVLENGYRIAQGFRDAKNPSDSWISGSYTIFYYIQNVFFNKGRMALNGGASINGTGFMIKKDKIDEEGFNIYSLTEDMEYAGICALNSEKVYFAENAITYDEYPIDFKTSWKQRSRWTAGNIECLKIYSLKLFKKFFHTGDIFALDMGLNFMGAYMHVFVYLNIIIFRIYNLLRGYGLAMNDLIGHIEAYFFQVILCIIAIKICKKEIKPLIKGIILFPVFVFSWLPINIIYIFKKYEKWEEIKHTRSISLEEIK